MLGYFLGQKSILTTIFEQELLFDESLKPSAALAPKPAEDTSNGIKDNGLKHTQERENAQNKASLSTTESIDPLFSPPHDLVDPIALLEYLSLLTSSDNPENIDQFAVYMDKLRQSLKDSPENLQILLDHFVALPLDSKQAYYITSLLQSGPIANRESVLNQLVQRLSFEGTPTSNEKLLQLVSNIGFEAQQTEVVDAVMNIALYTEASDPNKLFALDLLMPYQLNTLEKQKVVDELRYALLNTEQKDKSYFVESIMRYSDANDRQNLANEFLQIENDFSARVAVISSVHSGILSPNDNLKSELFNIALNNNDPLQKHARNALLYAFDINNSEYQMLQTEQ